MNRNYGLDVLRATAILLVLASHALFFVIQTVPESKTIKLISYFCGFWGVELFFVLSGFLIGTIIKHLIACRQPRWPASFWIRRWFRTIPCYLLFLSSNILWYLYLHRSLPESLSTYLIFAQNLAWEHPSFFPEAWSLSVEEYFYLLFPIIIGLLTATKMRPATAFLTAGTVLLLFSTTLRFVFAPQESVTWDAGIRKVVLFRLDALMYGIYLSYFIDKITFFKIQKPLFAIGLSALAASLSAYFIFDHDSSFFLKTLEFSMTSLGFMLIIPHMMDLKLAEPTGVGRFFKKTALWSYSMYLSNFLIYNMIQALVFLKYFNNHPAYGALLCIPLLLGATYLISALVYRIFEFPIMNFRENAIVWLNKYFSPLKEITR